MSMFISPVCGEQLWNAGNDHQNNEAHDEVSYGEMTLAIGTVDHMLDRNLTEAQLDFHMLPQARFEGYGESRSCTQMHSRR